MENSPTNTQHKFLKRLQLIHGILLGGMLLFTGVVYFLSISDNANAEPISQFLYLVPIIALAGFILSRYLFNKIKEQITLSKMPLAKVTNLQTAYIVQFALIETPVLFGLIAYMLTENIIHLLIAGLLIIYFYSLRPTAAKIDEELNLTQEEKQNWVD